jgi:hypothetical protein
MVISMLRAPSSGFSMATSEEYRRNAEECRRLAEQAADEIERASHIKMAAQWDQLAKRMSDVEARRKS